ncbi:MAG TPA: hypothetical protein VGJ82_13240 [Thermoanaerobaculia bacterium]|jgi:hypothetical protein
MLSRSLPWRAIALVSSTVAVLFALLLLPACCCVRKTTAPSTTASPEMHIPPIASVPLPDFSEAHVKAPTQAYFRNVWFFLDETMFIDIHELRGEMQSKEAGLPVNFDDRRSFILRVDTGTIGMKAASLEKLMNQYIFGYPNAPLRDLHVSIVGKQLQQSGIIHKVVDIPFTMWADVSADHGLIRIHPTKISICGINGIGLLKAVGMTLQKMLKMPVERGIRTEKNDLLLDPQRVLPPPQTELHLVGVHTAGDELIQVFDAGKHSAPLSLPKADEKNVMYFRGGTLRMGKLLMIDADMEVVDLDPADPFLFFIDRYNDQLVAGFERNTPAYGLIVHMKDWGKLP